MDGKESDGTLERLAESVADQLPLEFAPEESSGLEGPIKNLEAIQRIAAAYGSVEPVDAAGPTAGGTGSAAAREAAAGAGEEAGSEDAPRRPKSLFRWGHLEVLEEIGEGSYGTVYRAVDTTLDREVALKLRSKEARGAPADDRYLEEARRLAKIRHPNVLAVHGADVHEGTVGLWADLLQGKTLEERLADEGPLGAAEAAVVAHDLCRALAAIHGAGLVHGDVKAANVMREEGGAIVLLDFGSGRRVPRGDEAENAHPTGTPLLLAPEVLEGKPTSPASDLYALGVLLYRLVTAKYPVRASTFEELVKRHREGRRTPLRDARPDLPAWFVQAVDRALEPDPADRFARARGRWSERSRRAGSRRPRRWRAARSPGGRWRWPWRPSRSSCSRS